MSNTYFAESRPFVRTDKSIAVRIINRFVSSNLCVFVLAAFAALAFTFSKEFEFYVFVILYGLYVGLFADDLSPLMPLFIFCYVTPSKNNNPGVTTDSVFYGKSGIFLLAFVLTVVFLIFVRIANDRNMGLKKLFFKKRFMTFGMLLLGASYMLSGILWERYDEFMQKNLVFAALQFLSVFLLYFIFSATVDWSRFRVNYFVCIGIAAGLLVSYELLWVYANCGVITDGAINRSLIGTGWGITNNIGAIITLSIPFPFYFATKKLFPAPWILLGCALFAASILSCSRGSIVCAVLIFGISYLAMLVKARNKFGAYFTTAVCFIAVFMIAMLNFEELSRLFETIPSIYEIADGNVEFNDSERLDIYKFGIQAFLDEPIFGKTFYPTDFNIYDAATLDSFSSFFPPRWHNTIIQILASCGLVGICAYAIHRLSTVIVLVKRRSLVNFTFGMSMLALLLMSLLDCHFFNIGPVLFYSPMLAVMEFGKDPDRF